MGSLTGPANPIRATMLGLAKGFALGGRAKAAATIDSHLPSWAGGKSYDDALADERNVEALNEKVYPWLSGAGHFAGVAENPAVKALGAIGSAAKGLGGVAMRMLGGAGAGATAAAAETGGATDKSYTDPETVERMKSAGGWGAAGGAAGQLILGEPIRAISGALGNQIGRVDAKTAEMADAEIASAQGLRGKQAQEAVGGRRNLELEAMMERNAPAPQAPQAPPQRAGPLGLPPSARRGDPLYHVQGATPSQARQVLQRLGMSADQAEEFLQHPEVAEYLAPLRPGEAGEGLSDTVIGRAGRAAQAPALQARPAGGINDTVPGRRGVVQRAPAAAPQVGPAQGALNELGGARDELKQRGIDNAVRAIRDEAENPVEIPGRTTAMGNAVRQQNAQGWAEAKRGMGEVAAGVALKLVGNPMGAGTYNLGHGIRRLARAALTSPAVLNRLRAIPGAGRAIGNAAGRGSAALGATLYAMSKDPEVAKQLQQVDGELSQSEEQ
jgi:hypothetical protein